MKTYWFEITMPPYPEKGYRIINHRKKPERDSLSPHMVTFFPALGISREDALANVLKEIFPYSSDPFLFLMKSR